NTSQPKYLSHVRYSRAVTTKDVCFSIGTTYAPTETVPVPGEDWVPGTLIQDDGTTVEFNGQGSEVSKKDEIDWDSVRRSMTYEQTKQDFGFTKERGSYLVTVKVKGDLVNPSHEDDDAGSKNLFYFQLIFEHGKSGCTLANQQIQGDAFRTGDECQFRIPASQDYGDLVSIMVIPDNQDGNSDIYDKLKIEYITVEKETNDALSPTWTASSNDENGLGWVGIDYRDPGEYTSYKGAAGHSASEIATVYQITESSYNAKFLISITTGNYGTHRVTDKNGKSILINDEVYSGGMSMSYHYFDTDGLFQFKKGIDVIELMNKYTGRTGSKSRTVEYDNAVVTENDLDYYVSDPNYQFRASTTDNFLITVKDIYQFADMQLQLRSNVVTNWPIQDINISLVNGTGRRFINANGEYDYGYPVGMEPTFITTWTRTETLTKDVQVYRTDQNNSIAEINIALKESPISISEQGKWTTVVPREPNSKDDTVNLFLYPQITDQTSDPENYTMTGAIRYTNVMTKLPMQNSTGPMRFTVDENDVPVFYALGVDTSNMEAINGVDVKAMSLTEDLHVPINYGMLQRVRGGVLIESYYLGGTANAGLGGTLSMDRVQEVGTQKLILQMSPDIKTQQLDPMNKDLAIALFFKGDDPSGQELRSRFIYLSDLGITQIAPCQLIEIDFDLGNVSDITGAFITAQGGLDAKIQNMYVEAQSFEGETLFTRSISGTVSPSERPARYPFSGNVGLLRLTLETAGDDSSIHSGTTDPIAMTVGYYDSYGVMRTYTIDNIRSYVSEGGGFAAGSVDEIGVLVPEMTELRYIELEPRNSEGYIASSWKLSRLTAVIGNGGRSITRVYDQLIVQGKPAHIGLADILLSGLVYSGSASIGVPSQAKTVASGENLSTLLDSGDVLRIDPTVHGSTSGITAQIENYDPQTGASSAASLGATHGYTDSYLSQLLSSAKLSRISGDSAAEREAAAQVEAIINELTKSAGSFRNDGNVNFTAPRNFTGRDLSYRITVRSQELEDILFTVDVKVYPEADQLTNAVT
ncbi:MAG: hypothetical protein IJM11_03760, partial [Firmicutes bacterium]|nr:hypothetical protein [Bacillota bacterium]